MDLIPLNNMKKRALIIDDDLSTLELLKYQFEAKDFFVITADNGSKAINFIKEMDFDIILTDLNLPDINGIEMVKKTKAMGLDGNSKKKIVFSSGGHILQNLPASVPRHNFRLQHSAMLLTGDAAQIEAIISFLDPGKAKS